MDHDDVRALVRVLRAEGSDTAGVEVKRAGEGLPDGLETTLSALGNRPGGGTLVLGLDEKADFAPVGVYDAAAAQKALASIGRSALVPAIHVETESIAFEGVRIVVATVQEVPASEKPCKVRRTGKAYIRAYDGDYELSEAEVQAFVANRGKPVFDIEPVPGAGRDDLDVDLVRSFVATCRESRSQLAKFDDEGILARMRVLTRSGEPTLAGLLALGEYPQEWFPSLVIQASVAPSAGDQPRTRARDRRVFDGPVPVMLEDAAAWVRRSTATRIVFGEDGHGRDVPEYPAEAVRELIANALVHRDYGPFATNKPVTLRIEQNRLVIANRGGLWAMTTDRLGTDQGPAARRNEALVSICQNVRTPSGARVIEGLGDGIRIVLEQLRAAGMARPTFDDQGIGFTAIVPNHTLLDPADIAWLGTVLRNAEANDVQRHVLVGMRHGKVWTNRELRVHFPMDSLRARATLQGLVELGVAEVQGERCGSRYVLAEHLRDDSVNEPTALPEVEDRPRRAGLLRRDELLVRELRAGARSMTDLVSATGLTRRQVEYALAKLRADGTVVLEGGKGVSASTYRLAVTRTSPGS